MRFDLEHALVGQSNVALSQHNTAERDGRRFDQHVAMACRLRDGRICRIETFASALDGFNRFFVGETSLNDDE